MRKAAEHETLSKNRIHSGQTEITCPKVGMMLTGTFSQFKALVPSVENGFFSRLMTVVVRGHQDFDGSVFQPTNEGAEVEALIRRLAMQVKRLADRLMGREVEFRLTKEQATLLGQVMEKEYKEYVRVLGDGFHATVVRNGINVMRIAAVLTTLRCVSSLSSTNVSDISETITCSDSDFQTAMIIGTKLLLHAADAYNQIASADREAVPSIKGSYQKDTFFVSLPNSFSTGECLSIADKMGISERSTKRWLSLWAEQGQLTHTHGVYEKIA